MKDDNIIYSFIIPVFNGEKYIEKCLDSIVEQDSKYNYEIIIVNDGSNDSTLKIITSYKEKNLNDRKQIFILNQENLGISDARNNGIKIARGKYLVFVDCDDMIAEKFFDYIDKEVIYDLDIIKMHIKLVSDEIYDKRFDVPVFEKKDGFDALKTFCNCNKIYALAWSYLFKKELFDKYELKFPSKMVHEDLALIPLLIYKAKSVKSIDYQGYKYIKRKNSLSTKCDDETELRRFDDFVHHIDFYSKYFRDIDESITDYFKNRLKIKMNNLLKQNKNIDLTKLKNFKLLNEIL